MLKQVLSTCGWRLQLYMFQVFISISRWHRFKVPNAECCRFRFSIHDFLAMYRQKMRFLVVMGNIANAYTLACPASITLTLRHFDNSSIFIVNCCQDPVGVFSMTITAKSEAMNCIMKNRSLVCSRKNVSSVGGVWLVNQILVDDADGAYGF